MEFKFKRTKRVKPCIDSTPLIDCVFNLLIFFAVSTTLISTRSGINVNLPKAVTSDKAPKNIVISIKEDANIYFEDMQVTMESLKSVVKRQMSKAPSTAFIINADKETKYDLLVKVIDVVRQSGGQKLALAAEKTSPQVK